MGISSTQTILVVLIVAGVVWAASTGVLTNLLSGFMGQAVPSGQAPLFQVAPGPGQVCTIEDANVLGAATEAYTAYQSAANAELWDSEDNQIVGEAALTSGTVTSISTTAPASFSGYVMMGNDNSNSYII